MYLEGKYPRSIFRQLVVIRATRGKIMRLPDKSEMAQKCEMFFRPYRLVVLVVCIAAIVEP